MDVLFLAAKTIFRDRAALCGSLLAGLIVGFFSLWSSATWGSPAVGAAAKVSLWVLATFLSSYILKASSHNLDALSELSRKLGGNPSQVAGIRISGRGLQALLALATSLAVSLGRDSLFSLASCACFLLPEASGLGRYFGAKKGDAMPKGFWIRWLRTPFVTRLDSFEEVVHALCQRLDGMPSVRWARISAMKVGLDEEERLVKAITISMALSSLPGAYGEVTVRAVQRTKYGEDAALYLDVKPYFEGRVPEYLLAAASRECVECVAFGFKKLLPEEAFSDKLLVEE